MCVNGFGKKTQSGNCKKNARIPVLHGLAESNSCSTRPDTQMPNPHTTPSIPIKTHTHTHALAQPIHQYPNQTPSPLLTTTTTPALTPTPSMLVNPRPPSTLTHTDSHVHTGLDCTPAEARNLFHYEYIPRPVCLRTRMARYPKYHFLLLVAVK